MAVCEHCNSEHEPGVFDTGWFIVDGEIVESDAGEAELLRMARSEEFGGYQIFWSRAGAERELKRQRG